MYQLLESSRVALLLAIVITLLLVASKVPEAASALSGRLNNTVVTKVR